LNKYCELVRGVWDSVLGVREGSAVVNCVEGRRINRNRLHISGHLMRFRRFVILFFFCILQ